jgi:hypothetical protein
VTAHEVQECLEHLVGPVVKCASRRSMYSTSFVIDELDAELSDGSTLALVRKDLSWDGLLSEAVGAKPHFLYDPLREIEVYRSVLSGAGLGTAGFYGACVEPSAGRYWLFLERVVGMELWQVGDFGVWLAVARWLARLHQVRLGDARARDRLIVYDGDFYRRWTRRAEAFNEETEPSRRRQLAWVLRNQDDLVERLLELPTGFLHGELYASNVLVNFTNDERVCPIDWEVAAVGPLLFDLAALVSGRWSLAERTMLAMAYRQALLEGGHPVAHGDSFLAALDLCRLQLCVRWLGWAPRWSPPAEHSQDWLAQSVEIGESIGW